MARHVLVIGGGVVGLCTAWYAAERGWRVTVVDRGGPNRGGCSFGNAGLIVPSHFVPLAAPGTLGTALRMLRQPEAPLYVRPRWSLDLWRWAWRFWRSATPRHVARSAPLLRDLLMAGRALHIGLAELFDKNSGEHTHRGSAYGLARGGLLILCQTSLALDEEAHLVELAHEQDVPAEVVDAARIAQLDPQVRYDALGGVYFPLDAHLAPDQFMATLQARLAERPEVSFVWHTEVSGAIVSGRRIEEVTTTTGELEADEVVLAAGVWSGGLARQLGRLLPLEAGKGYSLTLDTPRVLPRLPAICAEARLAVTPMGQRLRIGGTMELAGLDESITASRVQAMVRNFVSYYPEFQEPDFGPVRPWSGLRPCSPDGLPYIGRPARYENLVVATGHAMLGLSLGPITGKLVAELLAREAPQIDLRLLSPDRFSGLRDNV